MIVGIGTDIIEISRVRDSIERYGERFLRRVFTDGERAYCEVKSDHARWASFAARFAAKEACSKALGSGIGEHVAWRDIEITVDAAGKPHLRLFGKVAERFATSPVHILHVSLSHSADFATAFVIVETVS
jgi:holo-[acyl-carrier protein] synthase